MRRLYVVRPIKYLACLFLLLVGCLAVGDVKGPILTLEPPSKVTFLNGSGASIHCNATGQPVPVITWTTPDGTPISDIPGLRMALPNGTLLLLPFLGERFRQDVHLAKYRCVAANSVGRTGSRDVQIKAVVQQKYEVQVYDEFVIRGNTAVLRCLLPSYVREHVIVTSWEREDGITITSNIATGGRYSVLPNGELHIRNVMLHDGFKTYRCQTKDLLSGEPQLSTSTGRLLITDPQGNHPPRLSETRSGVHAEEGRSAELTCVAQAYPLPKYRWFKKIGVMLSPVDARPGIVLLSGSLYFTHVSVGDAGSYVCLAQNMAGEARMESTLTVTAPLFAQVGPHRSLVEVSRPLTITCNVTGYPIDRLFWVKNQRPLVSTTGRIRLLSSHVLHISNVHRDDRGIYQCYAINAHDSAQSATELALGETTPELLQVFKEIVQRPGPSLSLQCVASGVPLPQVTWTIDSRPVPDNDRIRVGDFVNRKGDVVSHVNVSSVRVEDGGLYSCTAKSEVGEARHSARVNVYGAPVIRPMSDISAVAGEHAIIRCRVAGYPIAEIKWQKDGRTMPTNRRQRVFENGTLEIATVQKSEDEGTYTCSARGKDGSTAEGAVKVLVKEKPVILPVNIPKDIQQGMKVRIICQVARGDRPFEFSWRKNGLPIEHTSDHQLVFKDLEDDATSLTIESANPKHNGEYTCLVKNDVAVVTSSEKLTVLVPPKWRIEPKDTAVVIGQGTVLHCQAEGYPLPQIRWEKSKEKSASNSYRPVTTNYHYQIFENGSLAIQDVRREDAAFYLCQANNGIGPGLSTVISLSAHAAPKFDTKFRTQMVRKGESVPLVCQVSGDAPISITWLRDKQPFDPDIDPRYQIKVAERDTGATVELLLSSVGRTDSALYTCLANNDYGTDDTNIQLIVQEAPDPPRDVKITGTSSRFVRVSWEPPFSGNSLITNYVIRYRETGKGSDLHNATIPPAETTSEIGNLRPATPYELYILASNPIGMGSPSSPLLITTDEEVPEAPPETISIEATSSKTIKVKFSPPPKRFQNGPLRGYYVGYKEKNNTEPFQYKTVEINNPNDNYVEAELRGLKKFTTYDVVVQAYNNQGAGPRSDTVSGSTWEDVPSHPPRDVKCAASSSTTAQVTWKPPPSDALHGILQGYKVLFRASESWSAFEEQEITVKSKSNQIPLEGLEKYTNYSISVLAFTRRGEGISSDVVYCRTLEDIPQPPSDVKAMPSQPDAILVSWRPPTKPNGVILQYTLYERKFVDGDQDVKEHVVPGNVFYYDVTSLETKKRYEFWVQASTKIGQSEKTKVMSQVTSETIQARIASFSEQKIVVKGADLVLPCFSVGIPKPETKWLFNSILVMDRPRTGVTANGTLIVNSVLSEDGGNYTCRVENKHGVDEIGYSVIVKARQAGEKVLAPPGAINVIRATSNQLDIKWKAPAKISKLKGYVMRYKREEKNNWEEISIPASDTGCTLENLHCGTKYFFYITAIGKWGEGEPSETISAKTEGNPPIAAYRDNFIEVNTTFLTLHLLSWIDGGCPIKSFILRYKRMQLTDWRTVSNNLQPRQDQVIVTDLLPGTWYIVRVTAHNSAGFTAKEYEVATLDTKGGTVAPVTLMNVLSDVSHQNIWYDINLVFPIMAAFVALTVVVAVAIFVCYKRRQGLEDYDHPPDRMRTNHIAQTEPASKKGGDPTTNPNQRDGGPLYHTCGPKRLSTHNIQDKLNTQQMEHNPLDQTIYYDDDITPYATFRLPGCESDTESSYSTSRELQTFSSMPYRPTLQDVPDSPPPPPTPAHPDDHRTSDTPFHFQKQAEYEVYEGKSRHPNRPSSEQLREMTNKIIMAELENRRASVNLQQQQQHRRLPYQWLVKIDSPSKTRYAQGLKSDVQLTEDDYFQPLAHFK